MTRFAALTFALAAAVVVVAADRPAAPRLPRDNLLVHRGPDGTPVP